MKTFKSFIIDTFLAVSRSPFFHVMLPTILFYAIILGRDWMPIHDTFQAANVNHFFFSEIVKNGALPLWYPYINFGIDANWFLAIAITPSLALLLPIAKLLTIADFLTFYYISFFLDEIILLVGTYLLARMLFKSIPAVIFVCISMTGSLLWYGQPWFNLHLYYTVPLMMYFVIDGCQKNSFWRILAGGWMLLISSFGNLPYFMGMHMLLFMVFTITAWRAYGFNISRALSTLGKREAALLGIILLTAITYLLLLTWGVEHINYNLGRTRGSIIAPEDFLSYAGVGLNRFSELFTGTSWSIDINTYAGILVFSLAIFCIFWAFDRRMLPFLLSGVFFFLLSLGKESFVAPLVYYIPGIAYFRHLGLLAPLIKVMLIILAGFGFEILENVLLRSQDEGMKKRVALINIGFLVFMAAVCAMLYGATTISIMKAGKQHVFEQLWPDISRFNKLSEFNAKIAFTMTFYAVYIFIFLKVILSVKHGKAIGSTLVWVLLGIQAIDVYSYRLDLYHEHMVPIDKEYRKLFEFNSKEFAGARTRNYYEHNNFRIFASVMRDKTSTVSDIISESWFDNCHKRPESCYYEEGYDKKGTYYNTVEPFLGIDTCRSIFRVDYWLPNVDRFYRAMVGLPLNNLNILPKGYESRTIYFPRKDKKFNKLSGCEYPKLQVFSHLTVAKDDGTVADIMHNTAYHGDLLLVSEPTYEEYAVVHQGIRKIESDNHISNELVKRVNIPTGSLLKVNDRTSAEISILHFTANSLTAKVTLPLKGRNYWFYYVDAWHPFWRAYVNGQEVPVLKANLGFKVVEIPDGVSVVKFVYSSKVEKLILAISGILLISFMTGIIWKACHLIVTEKM